MDKLGVLLKQADKGGKIVLMTQENYVRMCKKILDNPSCYRKVDTDYLTHCTTKITELVTQAYQDGLINKETTEFLLIKHAKVSTHKNLLDPPGRPVISGIGSLPCNANRLVDDYLRPHNTLLPSYLKDTIQLLKILDKINLPPGCLLVMIDIESLYSSIPHERG